MLILAICCKNGLRNGELRQPAPFGQVDAGSPCAYLSRACADRPLRLSWPYGNKALKTARRSHENLDFASFQRNLSVGHVSSREHYAGQSLPSSKRFDVFAMISMGTQ